MSGDTRQWDFLLLRKAIEPLLSKKQAKTWPPALSAIAAVRNDLAHLSSPELSATQETAFTDTICIALEQLGMDAANIQDIRTVDHAALVQAQLLQPKKTAESAEFVSAMHHMAQLMAQKMLVEAAQVAKRAIESGGVTDTDELARLNESAARAWIERHRREGDENSLQQAIFHAKKSVDLRKEWVEGYMRLGECAELAGNVEEAVRYYEEAQKKNPTDGSISNHIKLIKSANLEKTNLGKVLNPLPKKTFDDDRNETIMSFEQNKGVQLTSENYKQLVDYSMKHIPGLEEVAKAHEYRDGSSKTKPQIKKAVEWYEKAVQKNNAEAMFNLAMIYIENPQFKVSTDRIISLLETASAANPKNPITGETVGVKEAQHSLANLYREGVLIPSNLTKAIEYYTMACNNGSHWSANDLGIIYMNSEKKDLDKSEKYLKMAISLGSQNARSNLTRLYIAKQDPDNAEKNHKIGLSDGDVLSANYHTVFTQAISLLKEGGVVEFPNDGETDKKVVSLSQEDKKNTPVDVSTEYSSQDLMKLAKLFMPSTPYNEKLNGLDGKRKEFIQARDMGSKFAERIVTTMELKDKALEALTKNRIDQFIILMSEAFRIEDFAVFLTLDQRDALMELVSRICSNHKMEQKSEVDRCARICAANLMLGQQDYEMIDIICKESIIKYPDEHYFNNMRGKGCAFSGQYDKALICFDLACKAKPNDAEYIYHLAVARRLRKINYSTSEALEEYTNFIREAAEDHRKIPESYYSMANCLFRERKDAETFEKAREYYWLGLEAEKKQLKPFLPWTSNSKTLAENTLLSKFKRKELELSKRVINPTLDPKKAQVLKKLGEVIIHASNMPPNFAKVNFTMVSQPIPKMSVVGLQEITIASLNPALDKPKPKTILLLTSLGHFVSMTSFQFAVQDKTGFVERIAIYNLQNSEAELRKRFAYGSQFFVLTPHYKIAMDGLPIIRVDNPDLVVDESEPKAATTPCVFCGRCMTTTMQSPTKCMECQQVYFCSPECLKAAKSANGIHTQELCKSMK